MTTKVSSSANLNNRVNTARPAQWKELDSTAIFVGLGIELGLKMPKPQGREMVRQVFYLADKDLFEH